MPFRSDDTRVTIQISVRKDIHEEARLIATRTHRSLGDLYGEAMAAKLAQEDGSALRLPCRHAEGRWPMINLAAIQDVRRKDRYSLAARALLGKALGGDIADDLRLGRFSMSEEPSARVVHVTEPHAVMCFLLGWAGLPWLLERFDEDHTLGETADYSVTDILDLEPGGERVHDLSALLAGDDDEARWSCLASAWDQVHAFYVREWSTIERIASRLIDGSVPRDEIPTPIWRHAGAA